MLYDIKEIKGGKLMTTEQMAKCQDEMQGKLIVAAWYTPCKPFLFVGLSVNQSKIEQLRKHDEYAGYMPDFDFEVKDGEGKQTFLDGHKGTEYFVFDNLESARKAVKTINELDKIDWLQRDIEHQFETLVKVRIDECIPIEISENIRKAKYYLNEALIACCKERKETLTKKL